VAAFWKKAAQKLFFNWAFGARRARHKKFAPLIRAVFNAAGPKEQKFLRRF
jgi:hypothetical protein